VFLVRSDGVLGLGMTGGQASIVEPFGNPRWVVDVCEPTLFHGHHFDYILCTSLHRIITSYHISSLSTRVFPCAHKGSSLIEIPLNMVTKITHRAAEVVSRFESEA